jgi:hypothetical protein
MQQQNQLISALLQSLSLQNAPSLETAVPPNQQNAPSSEAVVSQNRQNSPNSEAAKPPSSAPKLTNPAADSCSNKSLNNSLTTLKGLLKNRGNLAKKDSQNRDDIDTETQTQTLPLPKSIAATIPTAEQAQCYQALARLNTAQQHDLFAVFIDMLERDAVRFPTKLFKGLAKRAKHNQLSVPKSKPQAPNPPAATAQSNYPVPPPRDLETAQQTAQRKARESAEDKHSLRQMLRINSALQGITPEKLANKLMLNHLLPV